MTTITQEFAAGRRWRLRHGPGAAILRRFCARLRCGSVAITLPDGALLRHCTGVEGPDAMLVIHRWRMLRRLLLGGGVAFGESYIDGDWSSPDLVALINLLACNLTTLSPVTRGAWPMRLVNLISHALHANTVAGSKQNIAAHYDLGNAFYACWLDASMSYSSALYDRSDLTLEEAQEAKQTRIIDLLDLQVGNEVLEIGCGWGGLAARIARQGNRVVALTLSPAQREFANDAMSQAGLSERVDVRLQDYREVDGRFDRIVSIEMLEAVGEAYWPVYFDRLRDVLKPGGVAVLQVITLDHQRLGAYRQCPDFIQRYVFPGGMLLSPETIAGQIERVGLRLVMCQTFGMSYANTLTEWRKRFSTAWPGIAAQGFSSRFRKLWEFYLAYCDGGFRAGTIDVGLWKIVRPEGPS